MTILSLGVQVADAGGLLPREVALALPNLRHLTRPAYIPVTLPPGTAPAPLPQLNSLTLTACEDYNLLRLVLGPVPAKAAAMDSLVAQIKAAPHLEQLELNTLSDGKLGSHPWPLSLRSLLSVFWSTTIRRAVPQLARLYLPDINWLSTSTVWEQLTHVHVHPSGTCVTVQQEFLASCPQLEHLEANPIQLSNSSAWQHCNLKHLVVRSFLMVSQLASMPLRLCTLRVSFLIHIGKHEDIVAAAAKVPASCMISSIYTHIPIIVMEGTPLASVLPLVARLQQQPVTVHLHCMTHQRRQIYNDGMRPDVAIYPQGHNPVLQPGDRQLSLAEVKSALCWATEQVPPEWHVQMYTSVNGREFVVVFRQ